MGATFKKVLSRRKQKGRKFIRPDRAEALLHINYLVFLRSALNKAVDEAREKKLRSVDAQTLEAAFKDSLGEFRM